jgi:predicted acylesterase/phospholipase RssA
MGCNNWGSLRVVILSLPQESIADPTVPVQKMAHLTLALSGGGFRATLFHLGVLRRLRDCDCLERVKIVTAVSGGSIVAAHLARHWREYTGDDDSFEKAAEQLIKFTQSDLRGRLIRRFICSWLLVVPRLAGRMTFARTMSAALDGLYEKDSLAVLTTAGGPAFHILATSLTTGAQCKFTSDGFAWYEDGVERCIHHDSLPLSIAVSASAAFPPLFPAVPITAQMLAADESQMPNAQYLTDGGIFDNLGLQEALRVSGTNSDDPEHYRLIVSDAGGNFDWTLGKTYGAILARNVRATDILMDRVSKLIPELILARSSPVCHIFIGKELTKKDEATALSSQVQRFARNIRTDLDAFSVGEVNTLIRHGYSSAAYALRGAGIADTSKPCNWRAEKTPGGSLADARRRRMGLLGWGDPFTWLNLILVLAWLCVVSTAPLRLAYEVGKQTNRPLRLMITVLDSSGRPIPTAHTQVMTLRGQFQSMTTSDGSAIYLLPYEKGKRYKDDDRVNIYVGANNYQPAQYFGALDFGKESSITKVFHLNGSPGTTWNGGTVSAEELNKLK